MGNLGSNWIRAASFLYLLCFKLETRNKFFWLSCWSIVLEFQITTASSQMKQVSINFLKQFWNGSIRLCNVTVKIFKHELFIEWILKKKLSMAKISNSIIFDWAWMFVFPILISFSEILQNSVRKKLCFALSRVENRQLTSVLPETHFWLLKKCKQRVFQAF